jgi:hypothetical protein
MQKRTVVLVFLMFTSLSAWAEFGWSAWGRGVFTPMAVSDGNGSASAATSTSQKLPRVGFNLEGISGSGNIGFNADFYWDGGVPGVGENASVWVKPFPIVKLTVGKFNEDNLRGLISNTEFTSWILPNSGNGGNGGKDEDDIFTRFQAAAGAHLSVSPIENLLIEAAMGSNAGNVLTSAERANRNILDMDLLDVYKAVQIGIGYKIPSIGFVRAQFIGNNRAQLRYNERNILVGKTLMEGLTKNRDADVVEAAFGFNMIEDLNIEAGAKIPFEFTTDTAVEVYPPLYPNAPYANADRYTAVIQLPLSFAVGATYTWENFSILGRVDLSLGGKAVRKDLDTFTSGIILSAWLLPSYAILDNLKAGLDVGMEYHGADYKKDLINGEQKLTDSEYFDVGFGLWVEKNVGGGEVKLGLMIMLPGSARYVYNSGNQDRPFTMIFSGKPVISLPISFTYSF